jgi:hypothetical protein
MKINAYNDIRTSGIAVAFFVTVRTTSYRMTRVR